MAALISPSRTVFFTSAVQQRRRHGRSQEGHDHDHCEQARRDRADFEADDSRTVSSSIRFSLRQDRRKVGFVEDADELHDLAMLKLWPREVIEEALAADAEKFATEPYLPRYPKRRQAARTPKRCGAELETPGGADAQREGVDFHTRR
jgi:hypothetical protein